MAVARSAANARPIWMGSGIGAARSLYGLAAILFGVTALVWHGFNIWQPADVVIAPFARDALLYATAFGQIAGGIALLHSRISRAGAALLLGVFIVFAILHLPPIFARPLEYANWGALFEQLALVAAALIVLQRPGCARAGLTLFRVCVISFTAYQAFYIAGTAALVPRWMPPGQTFWAIATTIAFGLAAIAVNVKLLDVLAMRLMALMLAVFQGCIWIPVVIAKPHSHTAWAANAENLGIAAAACIVAEYLAHYREA